MNLWTLKDVKKIYQMGEVEDHGGRRELILRLKKGEFAVVVGPSGAGKNHSSLAIFLAAWIRHLRGRCW